MFVPSKQFIIDIRICKQANHPTVIEGEINIRPLDINLSSEYTFNL